MLSKSWCPVDLRGRINIAKDGFGEARFSWKSLEAAERNGTMEDFQPGAG
jgi:hypothetical protein